MHGVDVSCMGMYNKRYMHDMLDTSQKIAFISLKLLIQVTNHAFVFAFCDSRFFRSLNSDDQLERAIAHAIPELLL